MSDLDLSFLEAFKTSESNLSSNNEEEPREAITEPTEAPTTSSKWIKPDKEKIPPEVLEKQLFEKEKKEVKKAQERAQAIQLQYAKNISNSSEYRTKLCKGVKEGTPTTELLLLACNCISELTGDTAFLATVKNNLPT